MPEAHFPWPFLSSLQRFIHSISCHWRLLKIGLSTPWTLAAKSAVTPQSLTHGGFKAKGRGWIFFWSKQNVNALGADGQRKWKYIPELTSVSRGGGPWSGVVLSPRGVIGTNDSDHTQIYSMSIYLLTPAIKKTMRLLRARGNSVPIKVGVLHVHSEPRTPGAEKSTSTAI